MMVSKARTVNKKVFIIKFVHSILFWLMAFCLFYILYCANTGKYDWTLLTAVGIIIIEGLSLVLNRWRCPLTTLAEKYGAENGAITHLFMPAFFARYVFKFFTVLFIIELVWLGLGYFS
jgi:hypothetical protein